MVKWDEFLQALMRSLMYPLTQQQVDRLRQVLGKQTKWKPRSDLHSDFSGSGVVSLFQYDQFMKGFGPFSSCLANVSTTGANKD